MKTRAALGSIFASIAVLVVGWQAGGAVLASQGTAATSSAGTTTDTGTATGTSSNGTNADSVVGTTTTSSDGTFTGAVESTRFGDVQVSVTVAGGTITDVTALQLTDHDGRSVSISNAAAPILRQEVLAAQSAKVSNVSGATYTSDAYLSSLQSALDQAGL